MILPEELEGTINKYKREITNDQKRETYNRMKNTEVDIDFKAETKEFELMGRKEKNRVYLYEDYWITTRWGCFRIFKGDKEIHSMKTTDKLTDAKKYVTMLVNEEKVKEVV
ncbi:hypothetical protein V1503_20185 [Bacillus sp. SCS-151]|uniref:hypothetical protein n=1 Tax=Nanhaiella sioensis TaxID=3115293 RepID=UPI00397E3896